VDVIISKRFPAAAAATLWRAYVFARTQQQPNLSGEATTHYSGEPSTRSTSTARGSRCTKLLLDTTRRRRPCNMHIFHATCIFHAASIFHAPFAATQPTSARCPSSPPLHATWQKHTSRPHVSARPTVHQPARNRPLPIHHIATFPTPAAKGSEYPAVERSSLSGAIETSEDRRAKAGLGQVVGALSRRAAHHCSKSRPFRRQDTGTHTKGHRHRQRFHGRQEQPNIPPQHNPD